MFATLLWSMATLFFCWFEYITWTQFKAHKVFLIDAGLFDFVCSSFRHGHFLRFPLVWEANVNNFADHFRPIFMVIALAYFVVDHVMTLLTFFNGALVFAVVPLCYLARRILGHDWIALQLGLLYLTNVFTRSIHLAIHAEAMIPIGIFLLMLALEKRHTKLLWFSAIYLFSQKEDIPLYIGAVAVVVFLEQLKTKNDPWLRKQSILLIITSAIMLFVAAAVVNLSGAELLNTAGVGPLVKFASMGTTKTEVLIYLLTHPIETLAKIFSMPLLLLFLSVGGVALFDLKRSWIVICSAALFMVVDNPLVANLNYYYSYAALPFVFVSGIYGFRVLQTKFSHSRFFYPIFISLFSVIVAVQFFLPTRTDGLAHKPFTPDPRGELLADVLNLIPKDAVVCAQYDLYAQVPNRPIKLPFTVPHLKLAEYVLLDSKGIMVIPSEQVSQVRAILNSSEFDDVFTGDGFQLLVRVKPANAELYSQSPASQ